MFTPFVTNKDPDEILDYGFDWNKRLTGGDTISASTWIIPTGLTQDRASTFTQTATTIWLAGGTEGQTYELINRVTTTAGRVMDKTATLTIESK